MIWTLVLVPLGTGLVVTTAGAGAPGRDRRWMAGGTAAVGLLATLGLAVTAALRGATGVAELGPGWRMTAAITPLAGAVAVLVPAVALAVVVYAAGHEDLRGLTRLLAALTAFVGAMQLVVVAADLLTLLIGWELVGAFSYGLIAHEWRDPTVPGRAAHAFNATRLGDLGLFVAAGAAFAGLGTFDYAALGRLEGWALHALVAGIVLAAAAKSAQGPFAPWLFSAMAGPTPVSALLHSATMVAAGVYLLARLEPVLARAAWFGPTVVTVGLATAVAGGVVAFLQPHAKKLLAASTSAQHGLMLVAVGAGVPAAAVAHLAAHAVFKALLFLVVGIAIAATGSALLGRHRLGSHLPVVAAASAVGALALAGVPPLAGAWTKEQIVAAAGHVDAALAVGVGVAGGLSAAYAARFHLLAYGRTDGRLRLTRRPGLTDRVVVLLLAVVTVGGGLLFLPGAGAVIAGLLGGRLPSGSPWEVAVSLGLVVGGLWTAHVAARPGQLASLGTTGPTAAVADWLGLPAAVRRLGVDPLLRLADAAARLDERVVDAGVRAAAGLGVRLSGLLAGRPEGRVPADDGIPTGLDADLDRIVEGLARGAGRLAEAAADLGERLLDGVVEGAATGVGAAGRDSRRLQTGLAHHYLVVIVVGLVLALVVTAAWR